MTTSTMQKIRIAALASAVAIAGSAFAETMKGRVDAVNSAANTVQLNGITFQATGSTTFNGIAGLDTLKQGDRITIEFNRDGTRYLVTAISAN
ncbi:hypothetical protein E9531_09180 [Lampropedia puyangensis]|uniref:DUF5666 domain-containing protein n=1 Tax=Lampropedia puyangensis TaxID=1330072 RepID=A0A4V4GRB8_9BURK|nr:DUF5666 domain-containing protein [Lampropedia puyangensis]THU01526.1 hypothetical protein E9531_09180 [Lampropedia puyangensis]